LSQKESHLLYMRLADSRIAFFSYAGVSFNVESSTAETFDAFISQAVEEIKNVDRAKWPIFQKWRIINACLEAESLILETSEDGSLSLHLPEVETSDTLAGLPEPLTSGS
jgi:hypothetical protein